MLGLVFVGYELHQNQLALKAQARATLALSDIDSVRSVREDEQLLAALAERLGSNIEEVRFSYWIREQARTAEHQFYQYRIGVYDAEEFQGMRNMWRDLFSSDEYRKWWDNFKSSFSTEFQEEFDNLLESPDDV